MFLPNLPSVCALLYKIKHVVEITPVTFPKGMPDDFHPDTHGFKLTPTGEFIVEVAYRVAYPNVSQSSLSSLGRPG